MSKQTLILDSTQISDHYQCPMMWYLKHREFLAPSAESSEPIRAGSFGHMILENYYKNIHLGIVPALEAARATDPTPYNLPSNLLSLILEKFNFYWMKYKASGDIVPFLEQEYFIDTDPNTGLPRDSYRAVPQVERGFSYCLLDNSEFLFVLEGKIDVLGTYAGQRVIMDHKYQMRKCDLYKRRVQFKNYALATGINTVIVNYIRLTLKTDETTYARDVCTFLADELQLWKQELIHKFTEIAHQVRMSHFSNNWDACEGKYGHPCMFTTKGSRMGICENQHHNKQMLDFIKSSHYVQIPKWEPWSLESGA